MNEGYEWSVEKKKNKQGEDFFIAYIDPKLSTESTYDEREKIKEFGAKWDNFKKTWGFFLSNDPEKREQQIEKYVKPCITYLKQKQKTPSRYATTDLEAQNILKVIDDLINDVSAINTSLTTEVNTAADPKEIKERLKAFKEELIQSFSDGTWKQKMEPIIKYRDASGAKFSFKNRLLIWVQDPEATIVKSTSNWRLFNRAIKPDAPALYLYRPIGPPMYETDEEKFFATVEYLIDHGKLNGKPQDYNRKRGIVYQAKAKLTPGQTEDLKRKLNSLNVQGYKLQPLWYDVRFTEQMQGKEDLVGDPNAADDLEWFDGTSNVTDKTTMLYNAVTEVIKEAGINLIYKTEAELGGSRGYSSSGTIAVIKDTPKNAGAISTLVHEFSHEMLHQEYLKKSNSDYAQYFVGTRAGRGIVEQQAEISAWIVMRNFGYSMQTAVNYVGCWGGDEKNVLAVFDTVGEVAAEIINKINKKIKNVNESRRRMNEIKITGLDVAKMLGADAVKEYEKSLQLNKMKTNFFELYDRMNKVGHEEEE